MSLHFRKKSGKMGEGLDPYEAACGNLKGGQRRSQLLAQAKQYLLGRETLAEFSRHTLFLPKALYIKSA